VIILLTSMSPVSVLADDAVTEERTGTIIGIDLGTTYSCVGVMKDGHVEIIPNDQGNRITPSYVGFDGGGLRLVGDAAKNQATLNPENTIFDAKRFIGRLYSDKSVKEDKKLMPFEVVDSKDGKPFFQVTVDNAKKVFAPEEISAMVLMKLKRDAESFLGTSIDRAVVTVPAHFNDAQRHATRDAATIAGLHVERILNEPTAAAMAYGMSNKEELQVLVFDLGGGTFDVTVLSMEDGVFQVLATNGDTHLGGSDFDQEIMKYFIGRIEKQSSDDSKIKLDSRALQKLRMEVERVKRALSSQLQATLEIEDLVPGFHLSETLTRAKFELLNAKLFKKTLGPIRKVMEDALLENDEIDQIVMVGGSSRIPKIRELITEYFDGKEPYTGINPDEAVAYGAAVQGGVLSGDEAAENVMLLDVTPLSLGTESEGGIMDVLIKRGTTIPTEKSKTFYTIKDGQTKMTIDVYEGERSMVKNNHLLGLFDMMGLPPQPRGDVAVKITYKLDANGMLQVVAENIATKETKEIIINPESGRLSQQDVDRMVQEAEEYAEHDKMIKEQVEARSELESLLYMLTGNLNDPSKVFTVEARKELTDMVDETIEWLDDNQDAKQDEFESRHAVLDNLSNVIMKDMKDDDSDEDDESEDEL